jgi:hypothetical protein
MALSVALQQEAEQVPGLEQYALAAFGSPGSGTAHVGGEMRVGTLPASRRRCRASRQTLILTLVVRYALSESTLNATAWTMTAWRVYRRYANSGRRRSLGDKPTSQLAVDAANDYFEGGSDYHEQAKWWTASKRKD